MADPRLPTALGVSPEGAVGAPVAAPAERPELLVDPQVSLAKLDRQVELWRRNEALHRRRGLLLVRHDRLRVDLVLLAASVPVPLVVSSVSLLFDNYDLWPPSLSFTDPFTGDPLPPGAMPPAQAVDFRDDVPRPLVPGMHPATGRAFLCLPGTREYHVHPEHCGNHWLLHRGSGAGTLDAIATALHRTVASTVRGLGVQTTTLLGPDGVQTETVLGLSQGPAPAPAPVVAGPGADGSDASGAAERVIDLDAVPAGPPARGPGRRA